MRNPAESNARPEFRRGTRTFKRYMTYSVGGNGVPGGVAVQLYPARLLAKAELLCRAGVRPAEVTQGRRLRLAMREMYFWQSFAADDLIYGGP